MTPGELVGSDSDRPGLSQRSRSTDLVDVIKVDAERLANRALVVLPFPPMSARIAHDERLIKRDAHRNLERNSELHVATGARHLVELHDLDPFFGGHVSGFQRIEPTRIACVVIDDACKPASSRNGLTIAHVFSMLSAGKH